MISGYYVTVIRAPKRVGWLYGPLVNPPSQELIDQVRREACRIDPWCDFDAFGFSKLTAPSLPDGKLNSLLDTKAIIA